MSRQHITTRRVDDVGRIVLPSELRNTLDIKRENGINLYLEGTRIILEKANLCCISCRQRNDLTEYMNHMICKECMKNLSA